MIENNVYIVKTWAGDEKACNKVTLFPERDQQGEIFYKIEGQLNLDHFMIAYYYDLGIALSAYENLLSDFIDARLRYFRSE